MATPSGVPAFVMFVLVGATACAGAPPRATPFEPADFSSRLRELSRLTDEVVALRPETDVALVRDGFLAWSIEGWLPLQRDKRAVYDRARRLVAEIVDADDPREAAVAAALAGRMAESFAEDWKRVHLLQCEADPQQCAAGGLAMLRGARPWQQRARGQYRTCVEKATHPSVAAWARLCGERGVALDELVRSGTRAEADIVDYLHDAGPR